MGLRQFLEGVKVKGVDQEIGDMEMGGIHRKHQRSAIAFVNGMNILPREQLGQISTDLEITALSSK